MNIFGIRNKLRLAAALASCALVLSFVSSAEAANDGCLTTPSLSDSRKVVSKNLGNGVVASAWQWYPGADAGNAGLSRLGTKVSVVTGNLRNVDFGILHWALPQTANLDMLVYTSFNAKAAINGDYIDGQGPWSAMIEDGELIYAPPGTSNVVGMVRVKVNPARGYRSSGLITVGTKSFRVTGVNQLKLAKESVVVYQSDFVNTLTPKGQATFVFKAGQLYKVYPYGASVSKRMGTVVQVTGAFASRVRTLVAKAKVKTSLGPVPKYETRMASDSLTARGTVSNANYSLNFDVLNSNYLSNSAATLFDSEFANVTQSGKVTIRIEPDEFGRLLVKNVYDHGYFGKVNSGGYLLQVDSAQTRTALKFKVNDEVTITRSYTSKSRFNFVNAAGRGPRMVENGKFVWSCTIHSTDFRPRTALGWNEDGQIWLITSSRGQDAYDMGMRQGGSSTDQIGHWLQALGATQAFLLDGGGSTTMQIKDPEDGWQRLDLPDTAWYRGLSNAFTLQTKN